MADSSEHLVIDGYNLIYADEALAPLMELSPESARDALVARLLDYAARLDVDIEVVFDAAGREGSAATEEVAGTVRVTYTASGRSADDYIERLVYERRHSRSGSWTVVTGDYAQQRVALGAGMLRMSSREFIQRMHEAERDSREASAREKKNAPRTTVGDAIDPLTKAALDRLRKGL